MRPVGWKQLLRSSEPAVVCQRSCSNQWALWRRSGGDRRIRRTGTWRECCARDGTVGVAQYVISTLQSTEGRVNARETGASCNDWISWSNNYSVWPPRIEALEKLPGRSRRHKTTPVLRSVSFLAGCGPTISARENFEGPHVWPNGRTLLQDAQKGRRAVRET